MRRLGVQLKLLLIAIAALLAFASFSGCAHSLVAQDALTDAPAQVTQAPLSTCQVATATPAATTAKAPNCCKICRKGKACGDSCIARWKTCRKGPGCACDG